MDTKTLKNLDGWADIYLRLTNPDEQVKAKREALLKKRKEEKRKDTGL